MFVVQLSGDCANVRDALQQSSTPVQPIITAYPDGALKPDTSLSGATRICNSANFSYIMTFPSGTQGTCSVYQVCLACSFHDC